MTYDARQIANWFFLRAQEDHKEMTVMSLLKLCYIAHGWCLAIYGRPLFNNRVEAWQYGPVIPDIYNSFRRQGVRVTEKDSSVKDVDFDKERSSLLEQVWEVYGALPAYHLSGLTHVEGGPWQRARKIGGFYAHIPDALTRAHYTEKLQKADNRE